MTVSSDAFNGVKKFIGGYKGWRRRFPEITPEEDKFIRQSYKGGWVYVNPKYKNRELHNTVSYDVNSLYPWVMHDCLLPYGKPIHREPDNDELYVTRFEASFELKDGFLPTVQIKGNRFYKETEYLTDSRGIVQLCMTNIDYELFCKHYDIYYEGEHEYITFLSKKGLLAPYIDYWTEQKIKCKHEGDDAGYY